MRNGPCPLWGTPAQLEDPKGDGTTAISSRAGGKFSITGTAQGMIISIDERAKARITFWMVKQRVAGVECPSIDSKNLKDIASHTPTPVIERADYLLRYMERKSDLLGHVEKFYALDNGRNPDLERELLAWTGSIKLTEVITLVEHCHKQGWFEHRTTERAGASHNTVHEIMLTPEGYARLAELSSTSPSLKQDFTPPHPEGLSSSAKESFTVRKTEFDVALSFAGEDRAYVDQVAHLLRERGIKLFYDRFEEADLWGKDLYTHLSSVYMDKAKFTVMFISKAYGSKLWTNHERRAAQARAFQESQEYILPARFDDTDIPGVLPTIGYISIGDKTPAELVSLISKKLISSGGTIPSEFVRKEFSEIRTIPRADPGRLEIQVSTDNGAAIVGVQVVALADNNTNIQGRTGQDGKVALVVQTRRLYRILLAHPNFPASVIEKVDPAESVEAVLQQTDNVGSQIISSTGHLPVIQGRLNPILDTHNRTYLYANNIAINGGVQQPAPFKVNEPIQLEDANGVVTNITVKLIAGDTSLIQYLRPSSSL